ncbi:glycoside hydrolase [Auricularia subglabra TFB-10046 SS5]|nr:glycoside hydrolase [Auricularia subglabra TFB-10046 SS5]
MMRSVGLLALLAVAPIVSAQGPAAACSTACFPSLAFTPPKVADGAAPNTSLSSWWCSRSSEYGFMGFSYDVNGCPTYNDMVRHFTNQRNAFGARYVRLYASCDTAGHTDNIVKAAYQTGLGIFALVWFGFNGDDSYKGRLAAWLKTINTNPLAPYVVRNIAIGSEPLYDRATTPAALSQLIDSTKANVSSKGIQVSTSEMAYGYTVQSGGPAVLQHVDHVQVNELPFFSQTATLGSAAWSDVQTDLNWFLNQTSSSKKIFLTQTGWPSNTAVWKPNSPKADPSLDSEQQYYELLESKCSYFKSLPGGGLGWFAHIYADNTLPGWGIVNGTTNSTIKLSFGARSAC